MEPASADKIRAGGWVDDKVTVEALRKFDRIFRLEDYGGVICDFPCSE